MDRRASWPGLSCLGDDLPTQSPALSGFLPTLGMTGPPSHRLRPNVQATMRLRCKACGHIMVGDFEARSHAGQSGHTDFVQDR